MPIINQINNGDTGLQARTIINDLVELANTTSGFPYTGSANISGSLNTTDEVSADLFMHPQTITADMTIPAGYNGFLIDPVGINGSITVDPTANLVILSNDFTSASYALTASYALNTGVFDTSSLATTSSNTFIGNQIITGSVYITGSLTVNDINVGQNSINFIDNNNAVLTTLSVDNNGNLLLSTGSVSGTASYADQALTASYSLSTNIITSSFATTGSNIFKANQTISGSISITGSVFTTGSVSFRKEDGASAQTINFLSGSNTSGYALNIGLGNDGVNITNNSPSRGFNFKNAASTLLSISQTGVVTTGYIGLYGNIGEIDFFSNGYIYSTNTSSSIDIGTLAGGRLQLNYAGDEGDIIMLHGGGNKVITNGNILVTGSISISNILTLTSQDPLPSGVPTGSFAVSSSVPPKPYFFDGLTWNALY